MERTSPNTILNLSTLPLEEIGSLNGHDIKRIHVDCKIDSSRWEPIIKLIASSAENIDDCELKLAISSPPLSGRICAELSCQKPLTYLLYMTYCTPNPASAFISGYEQIPTEKRGKYLSTINDLSNDFFQSLLEQLINDLPSASKIFLEIYLFCQNLSKDNELMQFFETHQDKVCEVIKSTFHPLIHTEDGLINFLMRIHYLDPECQGKLITALFSSGQEYQDYYSLLEFVRDTTQEQELRIAVEATVNYLELLDIRKDIKKTEMCEFKQFVIDFQFFLEQTVCDSQSNNDIGIQQIIDETLVEVQAIQFAYQFSSTNSTLSLVDFQKISQEFYLNNEILSYLSTEEWDSFIQLLRDYQAVYLLQPLIEKNFKLYIDNPSSHHLDDLMRLFFIPELSRSFRRILKKGLSDHQKLTCDFLLKVFDSKMKTTNIEDTIASVFTPLPPLCISSILYLQTPKNLEKIFSVENHHKHIAPTIFSEIGIPLQNSYIDLIIEKQQLNLIHFIEKNQITDWKFYSMLVEKLTHLKRCDLIDSLPSQIRLNSHFDNPLYLLASAYFSKEETIQFLIESEPQSFIGILSALSKHAPTKYSEVFDSVLNQSNNKRFADLVEECEQSSELLAIDLITKMKSSHYSSELLKTKKPRLVELMLYSTRQYHYQIEDIVKGAELKELADFLKLIYKLELNPKYSVEAGFLWTVCSRHFQYEAIYKTAIAELSTFLTFERVLSLNCEMSVKDIIELFSQNRSENSQYNDFCAALYISRSDFHFSHLMEITKNPNNLIPIFNRIYLHDETLGKAFFTKLSQLTSSEIILNFLPLFHVQTLPYLLEETKWDLNSAKTEDLVELQSTLIKVSENKKTVNTQYLANLLELKNRQELTLLVEGIHQIYPLSQFTPTLVTILNQLGQTLTAEELHLICLKLDRKPLHELFESLSLPIFLEFIEKISVENIQEDFLICMTREQLFVYLALSEMPANCIQELYYQILEIYEDIRNTYQFYHKLVTVSEFIKYSSANLELEQCSPYEVYNFVTKVAAYNPDFSILIALDYVFKFQENPLDNLHFFALHHHNLEAVDYFMNTSSPKEKEILLPFVLHLPKCPTMKTLWETEVLYLDNLANLKEHFSNQQLEEIKEILRPKLNEFTLKYEESLKNSDLSICSTLVVQVQKEIRDLARALVSLNILPSEREKLKELSTAISNPHSGIIAKINAQPQIEEIDELPYKVITEQFQYTTTFTNCYHTFLSLLESYELTTEELSDMGLDPTLCVDKILHFVAFDEKTNNVSKDLEKELRKKGINCKKELLDLLRKESP